MKRWRMLDRLAAKRVWALVWLALAVSGVAGCSSYPDALNPFEWYRDITGASAKDDADKSARNAQNLAAGESAPYPNVGTVPAEPDTAMSTAEREKMAKTLAADRANALYSDEQVRQGNPPPPLPGEAPAGIDAGPISRPPAAPGSAAPTAAAEPRVSPPTKGSAPAPQESPLTTPAVRSEPQGEAPLAAPPAPAGTTAPPQPAKLPSSGQQQAALSPRQDFATAAATGPAPIMRDPRAAVTVTAAEIDFAGDGRTLSAQDGTRLAAVVQLYKQSGGSLRVIGHGGGAGNIASFDEALDRANAVAQALAKAGIPPNRITVQTAAEAGRAGAEVLVDY
ncbi:MAG TPA: OmpA family protein [Stellaceae bacterium]|nr:OmpA family protein [Stellaceae bacterium]